MRVEAGSLCRLMDRVHLGGILDECILSLTQDDSYVKAVDISQNLILSCSEEVILVGKKDADQQLGLGSTALPLICKFLGNIGDGSVDVKYKGNRLSLTHPNQGKVEVLLSDPETVITATKEEDFVTSLLDDCFMQLELKQNVAESFLFYMSLLRTEALFLQVSDEGEAQLIGGKADEHQFTLPIGEVKTLSKKASVGEFYSQFYGDHFKAVVQVLNWEKKASPLLLFGKEGTPLLIKQDDDNVWALAPVTSSDRESG